MSKLSGKELAREFDNFASSSTEEQAEFVEGFMRMHNTTEQRAFGILLQVVQAMADKTYVDGRNEASHKRAIQMVEGIKSGTVKELQEQDAYYWREDRAKEWVYGEHFSISVLPLV